MNQQNNSDAYIELGGGGGSNVPWTHNFNPIHFLTHEHDTFPSSYGGLFNRRPSSGLQYGYDEASSLGQVVQYPSSSPFGLDHAELHQKMGAQDMMDAKALAASKNHSEAERRRRERINSHLAKLRSLLPSTIKTDKASLLAEVIQHVKELKRQTSLIAESSPVPTYLDELIVDTASDEDGNLLYKASICCQDRTDLLPDLIKTLKALRLKTLKAEITTLGGRVRNVLYITGEDDELNVDEGEDEDEDRYRIISLIEEALKAVMEKSSGDIDQSGSVKRQRINTNILEYKSF